MALVVLQHGIYHLTSQAVGGIERGQLARVKTTYAGGLVGAYIARHNPYPSPAVLEYG